MLYDIKTWRFQNQSISFLPDNFCQLLINLGDPVSLQTIGSIRSRKIDTYELILSTCKSKGTIIFGAETIHLICARILPEFTRLFLNPLEIGRNTIYSLGLNHLIKSEEALEAYVRSKNDSNYESDTFLRQAIDMIRSCHGDIKIKDIYEALGVSKTFLEQRFNQHIGISAKEFCKVEKIKTFMKNYHEHNGRLNLTQLTLKSGYYDQSHLIKDFRYFMDCNPKEFLKSIKETANY